MENKPSLRYRFGLWLARLVAGRQFAIAPDLTDKSKAFRPMGAMSHDRPLHEMRQQYTDALTAWRKNPIAWRIIQITTDYTIGDGFVLTSDDARMQAFIEEFWEHPQNGIDRRLEEIVEELCRAGDIFPVLFRQKFTGVSIIRFMTKDQIDNIETSKRDWEQELAIVQQTDDPTQPKHWKTPAHSRAKKSHSIALHYYVNRPIGAMFGESDIATIIPWLLKYSRMLEDRVRLHWAVRMFLWFVKVPSSKVDEKSQQYSTPPEAGSVVVHDDSEEWKAQSAGVRGSDAAPDLKAVRNMIDAGSGYPPHWRGEATDVNLATAVAMQEPAERHLRRRQKYIVWMLMDITYQAYVHAFNLHPEQWPLPDTRNYKKLFSVTLTDVSRADNKMLAEATDSLAGAYDKLVDEFGSSKKFKRLFLQLIMKFAGEPQTDDVLDEIIGELKVPVAPTEKVGKRPLSAVPVNGNGQHG